MAIRRRTFLMGVGSLAATASVSSLAFGKSPKLSVGVVDGGIVGFSPGNSNVYIAVMHSGVTLAAIMGRYITHEITNDDLIDELAPYRPGRF